MADVTLDRVIKRYGDVQAVHGVSLSVEDGEFVVLVGPSGCGKSTTLRMIAGLEAISEGTVRIGDRVVNDIQPQHRNIAMVFQNYALYPHKSVRENIIFGLKRSQLPREEIEERLANAARMLQLEPFLDRKPAALSGGQRQRVAMGRAIVRDADVFLFDEPLSNLDAKLRHDMRTEIRRIHKQFRTTSIYVTHDQVEAMTLADKVVVMRDGWIEQAGRPMDIYLHPANLFTATFIGAPAMNILDATLYDDRLDVQGVVLPLSPAKKQVAGRVLNGSGSRPVKLGVRPDFFEDERHATPGETTVRLPGLPIDVVEPLGFDREVIAKIGSVDVMARLDLRSEIEEDGTIDLVVDIERTHLFDPESQRNMEFMADDAAGAA